LEALNHPSTCAVGSCSQAEAELKEKFEKLTLELKVGWTGGEEGVVIAGAAGPHQHPPLLLNPLLLFLRHMDALQLVNSSYWQVHMPHAKSIHMLSSATL
jgi:hypothetical protein